MKERGSEIITEYDVLFAARTGVTILVPKTPTLDHDAEVKAFFRPSGDNPKDLVITAGGRTAVLKNLQKDYIDEAVERRFIMVYEMEEDEVVRCTPCSLEK